jgi:hypothetical protein
VRRCIPAVSASASDTVSTVVGTPNPNAAANPRREKALLREINSISIFSLMANLPFNLFTHGRPAVLLLLDIETRFLLIQINKVQKSGTVESKNCWIFG